MWCSCLVVAGCTLSVALSGVECVASGQRAGVEVGDGVQDVERVPAAGRPAGGTQRRRVVDVSAPRPVARRHAVLASPLQALRAAVRTARL